MVATWRWETHGTAIVGALNAGATVTVNDGFIIPPGQSIQRVIARGSGGCRTSWVPAVNLVDLSPYTAELHYYLTDDDGRRALLDTTLPVVIRHVVHTFDIPGSEIINSVGLFGDFNWDADVRKLSGPPPASSLILNLELFLSPVVLPDSMNTAWMSSAFGTIWTTILTSSAL